ncbi:MAG: hypothetical protein FJ109_05310 [Deltaproteobacteria bacterium]|nr:hypothetical protein [Deltaproteobacteria bacterium]
MRVAKPRSAVPTTKTMRNRGIGRTLGILVAGLVLSSLPAVAEEPVPVPAGYHTGSMGGVLTFDEVVADLYWLHETYPDLVSAPFSIGKSWEGRSIWVIRVSANPDDENGGAEVFYNSLIHAREAATIMVLHFFLWHLVENYGVDPEVTWVLDHRQLWFAPVLNPDGYVYNEVTAPNGGGQWRKNRRDNGDGTFGVDLNRNFPYMWGFDDIGSSPLPEKNTYRGPAPFSEPETQAFRDFVFGRDLRMVLNFHSKGEVLLHPFGYAPDACPTPADLGAFLTLGRRMTSESGNPWGNPIQASADFTNGRAEDWLYGDVSQKPAIVSFSPEVGVGTWWPDEGTTLLLAQQYVHVCMEAAVAAPTRVSGMVVDASGSPVGEVLVSVEGTDIHIETEESGKFSLLLPGPGDYGLETEHVRYFPTTTVISVDEQGTSTGGVVLQLEPRPTCTLRAHFARAEDGSPASGVVLRSRTQPMLTAVSDGVGEILLDGFPAGQVLLLEAEKWGRQGFVVEAMPKPGVENVLLASLAPAVLQWNMEDEVDGWTAATDADSASGGGWVREVPMPVWHDGHPAQPLEDHTSDPGKLAWLTGNWFAVQSSSLADIDGGEVFLESPDNDLSGLKNPALSWHRWFFTSGDDLLDSLRVEVRRQGDPAWTLVAEVVRQDLRWELSVHRLCEVLPCPLETVRLRFVAADLGEEDVVEAALDDVQIFDAAALPDPLLCIPNGEGEEVCDGVDDDCDGATDEEADCQMPELEPAHAESMDRADISEDSGRNPDLAADVGNESFRPLEPSDVTDVAFGSDSVWPEVGEAQATDVEEGKRRSRSGCTLDRGASVPNWEALILLAFLLSTLSLVRSTGM